MFTILPFFHFPSHVFYSWFSFQSFPSLNLSMFLSFSLSYCIHFFSFRFFLSYLLLFVCCFLLFISFFSVFYVQFYQHHCLHSLHPMVQPNNVYKSSHFTIRMFIGLSFLFMISFSSFVTIAFFSSSILAYHNYYWVSLITERILLP